MDKENQLGYYSSDEISVSSSVLVFSSFRSSVGACSTLMDDDDDDDDDEDDPSHQFNLFWLVGDLGIIVVN
jgi:hypothetical protein